MAKTSKKVLKQIESVSVYDAVLREYFETRTTHNGRTKVLCFLDNRPEEWGWEETQAFDMAREIEARLKERVLEILSSNESADGANLPRLAPIEGKRSPLRGNR